MIQDTQPSKSEKIKLYDVIQYYYKEEQEKYSEDDQLAIEIFGTYCRSYHKSTSLTEVNEELFNKFFLYYLPGIHLNISETRVRNMLVSIYRLLENVKHEYQQDLTALYRTSYVNYADDTARIIDLRKELLKNMDSPVISWDPLVINFNYYKQQVNLKKKSWFPKKEIYEQGYFEMVEGLGGGHYLFKKIHGPSCYIKIKLDKGAINLLKHNDVLHMRIKRRLFSTSWEIIEVKGCYLSQIDRYLKPL